MKNLLFHAIQPDIDKNEDFGWHDFLREVALVPLPDSAQRLGDNVWLLPTPCNWAHLELAHIGDRYGIETRTRSLGHASEWLNLSLSSEALQGLSQESAA